MSFDKAVKAFRQAWNRREEAQWIYGWIGKRVSGDDPEFVVPGQINYLFVTLRQAQGAQTVVPARNDAGVPHSLGLAVRLRLENGTYVIHGRSGREDLSKPIPTTPSGAPPHQHNQYQTEEETDARYFQKSEHINSSAGVGDAGKPIVLGAAGLISNTMISLTTDNVPEGILADRNYITDAEQTKLAGIEAGADVTDVANVGAAIDNSTEVPVLANTDKIAIYDDSGNALGWIAYEDFLTMLNALYVEHTGDESIAGIKTFTDYIRAEKVGIGVTPSGTTRELEMYKSGSNNRILLVADSAQAIFAFRSYRANQFQSVFQGIGGRGTQAIPAASQNGDVPFQIVAYCDPDGTGSAINIASVNFEVAGVPAAGSSPGRVVFATTPSGSVTRVDAMTLQPTQRVNFTKFFTWSGQALVTAQFDKTNTTLANVTGLSVSVEAGMTYYFRAALHVNANATGGIKVAIGGTCTATSIIYFAEAMKENGTTNDFADRHTALGSASAVSNDTSYFVTIEGSIVVNAAGTLTVQFAQNAASGTSSVLVGSTFEVNQKV